MELRSMYSFYFPWSPFDSIVNCALRTFSIFILFTHSIAAVGDIDSIANCTRIRRYGFWAPRTSRCPTKCSKWIAVCISLPSPYTFRWPAESRWWRFRSFSLLAYLKQSDLVPNWISNTAFDLVIHPWSQNSDCVNCFRFSALSAKAWILIP